MTVYYPSSSAENLQKLTPNSAYHPLHNTLLPYVTLLILSTLHQYYSIVYYAIEIVCFILKSSDTNYNDSAIQHHSSGTYGWELSCIILMIGIECIRQPLGQSGSYERNRGMLFYYMTYTTLLLVGHIYFVTYQTLIYSIEVIVNAIAIVACIVEIVLSLGGIVDVTRKSLI